MAEALRKAQASSAAKREPGRGRIFDSIIDTIGDTPLVRLNRLPEMHGVKANILAKLDAKDRTAAVNIALRRGIVHLR